MEKEKDQQNKQLMAGLERGPALPSALTAAAGVEQTRAVAETQAAMVVAQGRPRDEFGAYNKIIKACARPSLAETAMYAFKRGGTMVTGPSIRLAEVLARAWGNITYGMRETSRGNDSSEIEAFAWDLESNVRVTRQFILKHIRDTRGGGKALETERDIYELAANMGQRRVRACLLELIPGDIVDAAVAECKSTLAKGDGRPIEDRVRDMIKAFDELGVTLAMIEAFFQHKVTAIVPAQLVKLQQIHKSIKDGIADRSEFFDINIGAVDSLNERFAGKKEEPTPDAPERKEEPEPQPEPPLRDAEPPLPEPLPEPQPEPQPEPPLRDAEQTEADRLAVYQKDIDDIKDSSSANTYWLKHYKQIKEEVSLGAYRKLTAFKNNHVKVLQTAEAEAERQRESLKDQVPAQFVEEGGTQFIEKCPGNLGKVPLSYCKEECGSRVGCPAWIDTTETEEKQGAAGEDSELNINI